MPRLRTLFVLVLCLGLAGGGAYLALGGGAPGTAAQPATQVARPLELSPVEVQRIERQDVARELRITGTLRPARRTVMTAQVSGMIETIDVKVGQAVAAGDVLLRFDQAPLESALAARRATRDALQAQLQLAQTVLSRSNRLGQSGISSEAARLEAEANVANLTAQLRGLDAEVADAERNLADGTVRAPFDGIVSERRVEPGQSVAQNTELLSLVDLSLMEVEAGVPASSVAAIDIGQSADFVVNGVENRRFDARVARIAPTAVEGSRTVRVYLETDNPDFVLRGGMFATGTLRAGERQAVILLPQSAIRRDVTGAYVLKVVEGTVARQAVEIAPDVPKSGMVEVAGGIEEGDVVVTAPLPELMPDTPIQIGA
ncbi:efflux RND transporter periplasmic adaptor subunit [Aureimonas frigidaquae]|uniref:RND family efflux transporter MFP subunit n=1 Tax=Aureimonas frigidaquae TaxID=424757 RepID=A0A0P0Z0B1_9HYPH|nr:efflux RND transporter periplasmic adaptor subunit [Aureimonas frigidaquae]BAT27280.1 RND family efflux transporter MFP subunit [Aureimonas frigidaquae]